MNTLLSKSRALALALLSSAPIAQESSLLVLDGVRVVDVVTGALRPETRLVIEGGRLVEPGTSPLPADARIIDATGKYVIPGLWDMHVHLVWGDWNLTELMIAHGVTGVRDMWGSPSLAAELHAAAAGERQPRIVMAGNLVDGTPLFWPDADLARTPEEGRSLVDALADSGAPFVKVYDSLSPATFDAILARAAERGLPVAGHVPMQVRPAHASDAGLRSIEHASGLLAGCSTEEEALLASASSMLRLMETGNMPAALRTWLEAIRLGNETYDSQRARALAARLARNETWVVPTLVALRGNWMRDDPDFRGDPRLEYVPREMRASWLPENGFPSRSFEEADWRAGQEMLGRAFALVRVLHEEGVPLLAGSDAVVPYVFAGSGLHDELALLVDAGLSPADALRAATLAPARFLGRAAELGTVEPGKLADLVLLDANPLEDIANVRAIHAVVLAGELIERSELDAMLAETQRRFRSDEE